MLSTQEVCSFLKYSASLLTPPAAEFSPVFVVLQVDCMEEALQRSQGGDLKVSVLLDYSRGSRGFFLPPAALLVASEASSHRLTPTRLFLVPLPHRTGQLQDHAAATATPLHLADARLSVPHAGLAGAPAPAGSTALQRDHRRPAH